MFGASSHGLNFYGDWGSPKDFIYGVVALTLFSVMQQLDCCISAFGPISHALE